MNLLLRKFASRKIFCTEVNMITGACKRLYYSEGMSAQISTDSVAGKDDFAKTTPFHTYRGNILNGQIVAYEGDAAFKLDGSNGDVFTHISPFYYRIEYMNSYTLRIYISEDPQLGFERAPMIDPVKGVWIGTYPAGFKDGKLVSMSGLPSEVNRSQTSFRTQARTQGYEIVSFALRCVINMLMAVKHNTLNLQNAVGQGVVSTYTGDGSTAAEKATVSETAVKRIIVTNAHAAKFAVGDSVTLSTGTFFQAKITAIDVYDASSKAITINAPAVFNTTAASTGIRRSCDWSGGSDSVKGECGMPTGVNGKTAVKCLNLENWWGNQWEFVDGFNRFNNVDAYVCTDYSKMPAAAFPADGWKKLSYSVPATSGYVQSFGFDVSEPWAMMTSAVGGTSAAPVGDHFYPSAYSDMRVCQAGGGLGNGVYAGPFYWLLNYVASDSSWSFGARLLFNPD